MAARKKTAARRSTGKAMVDWDAELAKAAEDQTAAIAGGDSNRISIRGGKFSYAGSVLGTELELVICDYSHTRAYYDQPFDQDNPVPPVCFVMKHDPNEMIGPSSNSPEQQSEECAGCWANEFKSDARARGKACGQGIRLAVFSADEDPAEATLATLQLGVFSSKNFRGYLKGLAGKLKKPTWAIVTKVTFDQESDFELLEFTADKIVTDAKSLTAIKGRLSECRELVEQEPDLSDYVAAKKTSGRKKTAPKKKAPAKKRRSKFS